MYAVRMKAVIMVALLGSVSCTLDQNEPRSDRAGQALTVEEAVDIQTAHPYSNHEDQSWTIRAPEGALHVTFTFDAFDTEWGYDFVDISDGEGTVVHRLSGRHGGETFTVNGDVAHLRFRSDYSITRYGFIISRFSYDMEGPPRPTDHRPYCGAVGSRSEGWYWGDTDELIRFERCSDLPAPECGAIGSRSEGWYVPDGDLIVWDNCRATVRIAIEGENCGPSIGFSCYDGLYCQGVPEGIIGGSGVCRDHGYCETVEDCDAEGNLWLRPMCMGHTTCDADTHQCGVVCDTEPLGPWSWTTYLLRDIESEHPYSNNFTDTWEVHHEGAAKIRVHFDQIRTERGYDRLILSGNLEERALMLDGAHDDLWTEELGGDTVSITLETDFSITDWGFHADAVSVYEQLEVGMCNTAEDCPTGEECNPSLCFSAYAPCYGTCMHDDHCDDGTMVTCRMMIPNCPEGTILAYQNSCYACVDPETCEEPATTYSHFDATGLPIAIPDNDPTGVESRIEVAGMAAVGCGVTTSLSIDHTWSGDLRVTLTRPDGTEVILHDRTGSSADDVVIVDENVSAGGAVDGEWILHVSDNASLDEGTLESWSLTVDCS